VSGSSRLSLALRSSYKAFPQAVMGTSPLKSAARLVLNFALDSHMPERSGLPSAVRGAGPRRSTLPSAVRGAPGVGGFTHWASRSGAVTRIKASADIRCTTPKHLHEGSSWLIIGKVYSKLTDHARTSGRFRGSIIDTLSCFCIDGKPFLNSAVETTVTSLDRSNTLGWVAAVMAMVSVNPARILPTRLLFSPLNLPVFSRPFIADCANSPLALATLQ